MGKYRCRGIWERCIGGKKFKLHQEIFSTFETWDRYFPLLKLSKCGHFPTIYILALLHLCCKYIFVISCVHLHICRTFVTNVETSLARVVTLTATFLPLFPKQQYVVSTFIIHYTKANSATLSILLHHSSFMGNNSLTSFWGNWYF